VEDHDEIVEEAGGATRLSTEMLTEELVSDAKLAYATREERIGVDNMRQLERRVVLSVLDRKWREHLYEMDYLKEGIGLRAMAQRDPLVEYQREGYQLFAAMTEAIKEESVAYLFNLEVKVAEPEGAPTDSASPAGDTAGTAPAAASAPSAAAPVPPVRKATPSLIAKGLDGPERRVPLQYSAPSVDGDATPVVRADSAATPESDGQTFPGTGRNEQCPCGSGKKYKVCHGKNEA